jgi:hypothetical protein
MCFDSARFLLGDFEGKGRADLMAVTARNGGTAFRPMPSTGKHFDAPHLWYRTTAAGTAETSQQYVAADFNGDGRAEVMMAQKRGDAVLKL